MNEGMEIVKSRELLTASRMASLLKCQRQHYWRYEVGLQSVSESVPLRFGHAWHTAMEGRWQGMDYEAALAFATEGATDLDPITLATLAGLLAGYYRTYAHEIIKTLRPETEFRYDLPGSRTFAAAGKIDGLGELIDGRLCMLEHKTTSEGIGADSKYWNVLRFNSQVFQYVGAARRLGHDVSVVLYDVVRKPSIQPLSNVPKLDEAGLKVVLGSDGQRVMKRDGQPKQSADKEKGEVLDGAPETPEQFADRLAADCMDRPDFYFARREVPILEQDLEEFETQRLEVSRQILMHRAAGRKARRPEHAWARNCGGITCGFCEFESFCMQNLSVDPGQVPAGFKLGETKNPELNVV
jgi:hypothetical protein